METQNDICRFLQMQNSGNLAKYLGLPIAWGKSKSQVLSFLNDRVIQKLQGWKCRYLSQAGKEILIKVVIQSVPSNVMSCFKLPTGIIGDLEKLAAKFWWRKSFDSVNIHWLSWKRLSCSKSLGGLGFKELNLFNVALLAKQAWRVIKTPEALRVKVLKGVYFPSSYFLRAGKRNNPSWDWKSLLEGREALSKELRWNVVGPSFLDAWNEPWIPSLPSFKNTKYKECAAILKIPPSSINREPNLIWKARNAAIFDNIPPNPMRSIVKALLKINVDASFDPASSLAGCGIVVRDSEGTLIDGSAVSCYSWSHLAAEGFALREALRFASSRGFLDASIETDSLKLSQFIMLPLVPIPWELGAIIHDIRSLLSSCLDDFLVKDKMFESIEHFFFFCNHAIAVWFGSRLGFIPRQEGFGSFLQRWQSLVSFSQANESNLIILASLLCWQIWKARNAAIFYNIPPNPMRSIIKAQNAFEELLSSSVQQNHAWKHVSSAWLAPVSGLLKINVDASFDPASSLAGCGIMVCDSEGTLIDGSAVSFYSWSPLAAKGFALREALRFASSRGFLDASIETDSLKLSQFIMLPLVPIPRELEAIIHDIRSLLSSYLSIAICLLCS
ncbi:uncharacterized protein LOC110671428 [Hevea brasiliensis]|uniref:uncharacterized protein LOC110671428 n=1 Tax=Hevea brasiliensis TaxID=3981 RepID=UPI0025F76DC9|nr:uncharacterized protein LOC110671428 [Hevea brasiliensis]